MAEKPNAETLKGIAEAVMERSLSQPSNLRFLVGIAGGPAAGKTTIAGLLADEINRIAGSRRAIVIPMDGFHKKSAVLQIEGLLHFKGTPETFDVEAFWNFLLRLKRFERCFCGPDYSRELHDVVDGAYEVGGEDIAIVEGNYLYLDRDIWRNIRALLDLKLFIEVDLETAIKRLRLRHLRGGKSPEEMEQHMTRVDLPNFRLIEATRSVADRIIRAPE
jgi:pantothenate kinase